MSNSKTGRKRFVLYPDRFRIPVFDRDISFSLIRDIPFFFSSSPASFQPNSLGLDVPTCLPCPPHLSVSPSTCHRQPPLWLCPPRPRLRCLVILGRCQPLLRLWVVVVTMYHHLFMYFYVLMLSLLDDWARSYGSVFPIYLSVDHSLSTLIRSNWFGFNIPWVRIRIPVRLIRFRYHFRIKI